MPSSIDREMSAVDATSVDRVFPSLPGARRLVTRAGVRNVVEESRGTGYREFLGLSGDTRIMLADFCFADVSAGIVTGDDYLKFHYKISGRNMVRFGGRPDVVLEGGRSAIVYHPKGMPKEDLHSPNKREISLTVACKREALAQALQISADELPDEARKYFENPSLDFLCDELPLTVKMTDVIRELFEPRFGSWLRNMHVEARVLDLMCLSLEQLADRQRLPGASLMLKAREIEMLHQVKRVLDERFAQPISISGLCRTFATNRSKLSEGFRLLFNVTIFEYIHARRMEHAKALLLDTDMAVSEVAEQAGYHRQSSFSTAFKEHHGLRPLDLRRRGAMRA